MLCLCNQKMVVYFKSTHPKMYADWLEYVCRTWRLDSNDKSQSSTKNTRSVSKQSFSPGTVAMGNVPIMSDIDSVNRSQSWYDCIRHKD